MGLRFASVDVVLDQTLGAISPRLFGSACWYADGHVWVGEDSPIPNTRGFSQRCRRRTNQAVSASPVIFATDVVPVAGRHRASVQAPKSVLGPGAVAA